MSSEKNVETFRKLMIEGFSRGNVQVIDEVFGPDFVEHQDGISPPNAEGVKGAISFLHAAMPDLTIVIDEVIAHGDKTWARMTAHGTNTGPFMGMPPTNRSYTITVIDICRFVDGKIVEHWGVADRLAQLSQLGLFPPRRPEG